VDERAGAAKASVRFRITVPRERGFWRTRVVVGLPLKKTSRIADTLEV